MSVPMSVMPAKLHPVSAKGTGRRTAQSRGSPGNIRTLVRYKGNLRESPSYGCTNANGGLALEKSAADAITAVDFFCFAYIRANARFTKPDSAKTVCAKCIQKVVFVGLP